MEGAWRTLMTMLEVGQQHEQLLENISEDMVEFALNHHDYAALALEVMDALGIAWSEGSGLVGMTWALDRADLLARAGRLEESAAIYKRVLEDWRDGSTDLYAMVMSRWDQWQAEWQPQ